MLLSNSSPLIASNASCAFWYFSSKVSISEDVSISAKMDVISFCKLINFSPIYSKTVVSFGLSSCEN